MSSRSTIIYIILAVLVALGIIWAFQSSRAEDFEYESEPDLYVQSQKIPPTDTRTLSSKAHIRGIYAVQTRSGDKPQELEYDALIRCLIHFESKGDPEAYNPRDTDGKPKFGILQFGRTTFQEECVEERGFRNDIWDPDIQKECASEMIGDGQLGRWGTKNYCIQ